jgi:hypothetical protein
MTASERSRKQGEVRGGKEGGGRGEEGGGRKEGGGGRGEGGVRGVGEGVGVNAHLEQ